jgi:hypothetical protein
VVATVELVAVGGLADAAIRASQKISMKMLGTRRMRKPARSVPVRTRFNQRNQSRLLKWWPRQPPTLVYPSSIMVGLARFIDTGQVSYRHAVCSYVSTHDIIFLCCNNGLIPYSNITVYFPVDPLMTRKEVHPSRGFRIDF